MNVTDETIDALTDDGDEVTVGRYTVRLHIEPDPDVSLNDYDCYGTVSDYVGYSSRDHVRPDGFDGAARKVAADRGGFVWWQPPDDVKSDPAATETLYRLVRDLCEYGFTAVGLSVHETVTDSRGGAHEVEVIAAWLGGIDSLDDKAYKRSVIADLFLDLPTF